MAKEAYSKTGNNMLSRWGDFWGKIPIIGGWPAAIFTALGAGIESVGWLLRGKPLSAMTAAATGAAATVTNYASGSGLFWLANVGSGMVTGHSATDYARGLTEGVVDVPTKFLGVEPTVLRSYTAGIGSINGTGQAASGPGYWASRASRERGQDPNAMYANYVNGDGGVHVNELGSAYGRSA